jgi:hypothetical protein
MTFDKNNIIEYPQTSSLFALYDRIPVENQHITIQTPILTSQEIQIRNTFFSSKNVINIINNIENQIYSQTNKRNLIPNNSFQYISNIMKDRYKLYPLNNINNLELNINKLNIFIINYCVKKIIDDIKSQKTYINDINNLSVPIDYPQFSSNKHKQLERKELF